MSAPARIVALGGGHGLYATLTSLRGLSPDLTAVVTVADDGGSSGRLRAELGILPPGDLRMALSALCADNEWGRTWRDVLQWRFASDGDLDGHAMGNLLIAALWDRTDDPVAGLAWVARLLQCQGRVLPLAAEPLEVSAQVRRADAVEEVVGQVAVASASGTVEQLRISPPHPRVPDETVTAIREADLIVLGPGSWYTSVLTHFHVEAVAAALADAGERSVLVLNVGHDDEETAGTGRTDDIAMLRRHAPSFAPATVLVDRAHADEPGLVEAVADWGAHLRVSELAREGSAGTHDTDALRGELRAVATERGLDVSDGGSTVAGYGAWL